MEANKMIVPSKQKILASNLDFRSGRQEAVIENSVSHSDCCSISLSYTMSLLKVRVKAFRKCLYYNVDFY